VDSSVVAHFSALRAIMRCSLCRVDAALGIHHARYARCAKPNSVSTACATRRTAAACLTLPPSHHTLSMALPCGVRREVATSLTLTHTMFALHAQG
jgi:hypothetical protein